MLQHRANGVHLNRLLRLRLQLLLYWLLRQLLLYWLLRRLLLLHRLLLRRRLLLHRLLRLRLWLLLWLLSHLLHLLYPAPALPRPWPNRFSVAVHLEVAEVDPAGV